MEYKHLKRLPNFTEEDGEFIDNCYDTDPHYNHQQMAISEMYLSKTIDLSAKNLISTNEQLAKSNRRHALVMAFLTGALVFVGIAQIYF